MTYVGSAFRRAVTVLLKLDPTYDVTVRLKPDPTYEIEIASH
jgi:hypothetical protein